MDKKFIKHYILATYSDNDGRIIRNMNMAEVVSKYELVTDRIRRAMLANDIQEPEKLITYSFRMLGDFHDQSFHRRELTEVNLDVLRNNVDDFPWEDWGWVVAFQPLVDVAGYAIVEIDSEYRSFGPTPVAQEDYIQPCFRIYEGGAPDWDVYDRFERNQKHRRRVDDEPIEAEVVAKQSWISEVYTAFKENLPTVLAVATSIAAVTVMLKTAQHSADVAAESAKRGEEILRHIEDSIDDVIDMPQVVKVELGDDIEVIGTGRRTW